MRRREVIAGLASAVAWPRGARAQKGAKVPVVGVLAWGASGRDAYVDLFREGMREIGYAEGRDVTLDVRYADASAERAQAALRDFVRGEIDVIVACTTPSAHAAKSATASIPIVMAPVADAIATGLVTNLARPAGNITGVTAASPQVTAKTLEVLREVIPGLSRVGFLGSTRDPNAPTFQRETEAAAAGLGVLVHAVMVAGLAEFEGALTQIAAQGAQALIVQPIFANEGAAMGDLAIRHRLPTASTASAARSNGFLIGYGAVQAKMMRQAAVQVDKILKGAKPGDLPVEQPTHFELVVNLKTAAALGLAMPPTLLVRADEVIE
jgi:putative tryptophan/tyrosine transport system substrate-binding protein